MHIERLQLQSEVFQESFRILSKAKNPAELAQFFYQILRGSLLVVNYRAYFKEKDNDAWKMIFSKTKSPDTSIEDIIKDVKGKGIFLINHHDFKISINHIFFDTSEINIFLGTKLDKSGYSDFDIISLRFFLQQLDSAYQLLCARIKENQLIFALNHRVLQLNSLIDLGIEVTRLQSGNKFSHSALEKVVALTNASKGMLKVEKGQKIIERVFYPFQFRLKDTRHRFQISTSFGFLDKKFSFYLFEKEDRRGLIAFDKNDQVLLDAFARQVNISLENHYLYEQSLERERIDREISLAGLIQKNLIPEELPAIKGYDQFGINIPAKFVGGDYYDCISLKDGRFMFIMADVSGKGVAAGLLVSTLHASVHAYVDGPFELEVLVQKLNEVICHAAPEDKFITAVFAVLDPQSNEIILVSAGHNPTFILRKSKEIEELWGGLALGMMSNSFPYESSKNILHPGDSVLFYTDGITEAMNINDEEYDNIRSLRNFILSHKAESAQSFIADLLDDLRDFTGNKEQSDDITALFLIRKDATG